MTYIAHVPGFALSETDEAALGGLRLRHLTFSEWREVDSDFPFQEGAYRQNRPLFVLDDSDHGVYVPGDHSEELAAFVSGPAAIAHLALNLRNPECPRHAAPVMSMSYLRRGDYVAALAGPLDREAIVWGLPAQPTEPVANSEMEAVRYLQRLIESAAPLGSLSVLVEALETSSRPDVDEATGFCLCIAALDILLGSETVGQLTATFSRRVAAAATDAAEDHDALATLASDFYTLRSEIVHGRVRTRTLDKVGLASVDQLPCSWARDIVRPVLLRLLGLKLAGVSEEELPELLDGAADDGGRTSLQARASEGWRIPNA